MKTILISSAISLAIGFTFGWLIKSASSELDSIATVAPSNQPHPRAIDRAPDSPPERERPPRPQTDSTPFKGLPNGTASVPESVKKADRAKWMRLIEVLSLDNNQAKALEAVMAEGLPKTDTGQPPEVTYTQAGESLEKNILALLNPEQRVAFLELQQRSLENRIEAKTQQAFFMELAEFDLSAEQRTRTLDLLRNRVRESSAAITPATRLLLAGSFLPIGSENLTEDSILLFRQLAPQDPTGITLESLALKRRAEADEKAKLLEGVLTPAQLELYRTRISETPDILDQIRSGG